MVAYLLARYSAFNMLIPPLMNQSMDTFPFNVWFPHVRPWIMLFSNSSMVGSEESNSGSSITLGKKKTN
jgi:hypothetical protein